MSSLSPSDDRQFRRLIQSRKCHHSLPREFYRDELIYRADIERIWRRGWLFVGQTCQIPEPGDYFTFELEQVPPELVEKLNRSRRRDEAVWVFDGRR